MKKWHVQWSSGCCRIIKAKDKESALRKANKIYGPLSTNNSFRSSTILLGPTEIDSNDSKGDQS